MTCRYYFIMYAVIASFERSVCKIILKALLLHVKLLSNFFSINQYHNLGLVRSY